MQGANPCYTVLQEFAPLLSKAASTGSASKERPAVVANLSARVGSISDNSLGGWYSYRASKAALNQLLRTASVEVARRRPQAVLLALHPGTVRTGLSGPFTSPGQGITPSEAAIRLLATMDAATQTGVFLDNAGNTIPW